MHVQVSKLKTAATSVKSLASKIDDLKHQAKSLDEVIRGLKRTITDNSDKEITSSNDDKEVVPPSANLEVNQENTASQESSTSTSDNSSTEVVTMTTTYTTASDISFTLATVESKIGPGDNMTLKIDDEPHPKFAVTESVELPRTTAAATSPNTVAEELDVCEEKHANIQPEMRMSTAVSNIVESIPKPDIHDLEDFMPMEQ